MIRTKRFFYTLLTGLLYVPICSMLAMEQEKQAKQDFSSLATLAENKLKKPKLEQDYSPFVLGVPHPF